MDEGTSETQTHRLQLSSVQTEPITKIKWGNKTLKHNNPQNICMSHGQYLRHICSEVKSFHELYEWKSPHQSYQTFTEYPTRTEWQQGFISEDDLWAINWSIVEILSALVMLNLLSHKVSYVMTVQLWWHVQNCDMSILLFKIIQNLDYELIAYLWNGSQELRQL